MDGHDAVWKAVRSRRAIRRFADRPLEPEHLERILHAGRRANSSKNQQRWAFIVCRDRAHLQELAAGRAICGASRRGGRRDRARDAGSEDGGRARCR